jgi:zinc transporter 7
VQQSAWTQALTVTGIISVLPNILLVFLPEQWFKLDTREKPNDEKKKGEKKLRLGKMFLMFAAAGLLGDVFLHAVPHILHGHTHVSHNFEGGGSKFALSDAKGGNVKNENYVDSASVFTCSNDYLCKNFANQYHRNNEDFKTNGNQHNEDSYDKCENHHSGDSGVSQNHHDHDCDGKPNTHKGGLDNGDHFHGHTDHHDHHHHEHNHDDNHALKGSLDNGDHIHDHTDHLDPVRQDYIDHHHHEHNHDDNHAHNDAAHNDDFHFAHHDHGHDKNLPTYHSMKSCSQNHKDNKFTKKSSDSHQHHNDDHHHHHGDENHDNGHSHGFESKEVWVPLLILSGFLLFFVSDKVAQQIIGHGHENCHDHSNVEPSGWLNIVADSMHNFTDGISLGVACTSGSGVAVAMFLSVLIHELPHELSDFAILVRAGMTKWQAIKMQFVTAVAAMLGAMLGVYLAEDNRLLQDIIGSLTAGGFVYIATVSLLPDILRHSDEESLWQVLGEVIFFAAGVLMMVVVGFLEA